MCLSLLQTFNGRGTTDEGLSLYAQLQKEGKRRERHQPTAEREKTSIVLSQSNLIREKISINGFTNNTTFV